MKLFNKKDVKSWSNCTKEKLVGACGYFGYNLQELEYRVKHETPKILSEINADSANAFKTEGAWYPFFLQLDKIKDPTYKWN